MSRLLDVSTSFVSSILHPFAGVFVRGIGARPEARVRLYEFEGCPFCRKVREMLTTLDLDAAIFPCPKGGTRFRGEVAKHGKRQFPFLIDPNTGEEMFESDTIVQYLADRYGDGKVPLSLRMGPLTVVTGSVGSLLRYPKGTRARPSRQPEGPLELYSYEGSPYCRIVREALSELELPYVLHNVGRGSPRRAEFVALSGKMQVPYLVDPNTGTAMFESADIVAYLDKTYAL
ncbi:MAG: glutathione S-transferase N-terminal domain-containing protein [Nannocystis sp.]|nr:glutathione S-transferase N-terminal domain-containing protein [Nannocystis sp.]MBA3548424.1 glutathione S-transferase N-terminal domain-containing protein [Nannocystis sp.]